MRPNDSAGANQAKGCHNAESRVNAIHRPTMGDLPILSAMIHHTLLLPGSQHC